MIDESSKTFTCLGGACTVVVGGVGLAGGSDAAVLSARDQLLEWHERFSRFLQSSELSSLNRDPRERVPVSPVMARFVQAAVEAASATGGLVDATLLDEIEDLAGLAVPDVLVDLSLGLRADALDLRSVNGRCHVVWGVVIASSLTRAPSSWHRARRHHVRRRSRGGPGSRARTLLRAEAAR